MSENRKEMLLLLKCGAGPDNSVGVGTAGDSFALFDNVASACAWLRSTADEWEMKAQVHRDRVATGKENV